MGERSAESRKSSKSPGAAPKSPEPEAPPVAPSPAVPEVKDPRPPKRPRSPLQQPDVSKRKEHAADNSGAKLLSLAVREESALVAVEQKSDSGSQLCPRDRAELTKFFDGASTRELLLESAAVMSVPDLYVPEILNGFPHSFQGLSQEGVINLLAVFAACVRHGPNSSTPASDLCAEVRQSLVVNSRGQRIMRKTILVDGVTCSSEEQLL